MKSFRLELLRLPQTIAHHYFIDNSRSWYLARKLTLILLLRELVSAVHARKDCVSRCYCWPGMSSNWTIMTFTIIADPACLLTGQSWPLQSSHHSVNRPLQGGEARPLLLVIPNITCVRKNRGSEDKCRTHVRRTSLRQSLRWTDATTAASSCQNRFASVWAQPNLLTIKKKLTIHIFNRNW